MPDVTDPGDLVMTPTDRPLTSPPSVLIDEKAVVAMVLISGKTLKRRIREGKFPAPIVIGHLKRWPRAVIENWIVTEASRAAGVKW
ncbi:MAG: hypothetical protein KF787_00380 [Phycisphaeraceae bacterium]|nr:hypothetical protein [Phycisphaeraceae bacterium]